MNIPKHGFQPLEFRAPTGNVKTDWCSFTPHPVSKFLTLTEEELRTAICGKLVSNPIHIDPATFTTGNFIQTFGEEPRR